MKYLLSLLITGFFFEAMAVSLNYQQLMTKDYMEMKTLLEKHLKPSREGDPDKSRDELVAELRQALTLLLMRPDRDGLGNSLINPIKEEVSKYESFSNFLDGVVQESLSILNSKNKPVVERASHLFVIENALSYAKTLDSNKVLKTIRKAQVKVPKDVVNERRLNAGLGEQASPSQLAKRILKKRKKAQKIKKRKLKKAKKQRERSLRKKSQSKDKVKEDDAL